MLFIVSRFCCFGSCGLVQLLLHLMLFLDRDMSALSREGVWFIQALKHLHNCNLDFRSRIASNCTPGTRMRKVKKQTNKNNHNHPPIPTTLPPHPALSPLSHSIPISTPAPTRSSHAQTPIPPSPTVSLCLLRRTSTTHPYSKVVSPHQNLLPYRSSAIQAHKPTTKAELNRRPPCGVTRAGWKVCAALREIKDRVRPRELLGCCIS